MDKISVQSLNTLFDFLSRDADRVLWIRNKEYDRQIYVNQKFEDIWQLTTDSLYQNPALFDDFLLPMEKSNAMDEFQKRIENSEHSGTVLFKSLDKEGNVLLLKDRSFKLIDHDGQHVGYVGIGQELNAQQWNAELALKSAGISHDEIFKKQIFSIIQKELNLNPCNLTNILSANPISNIHIQLKGKNIPLTQREQECLFYLLQGKSSKQIAAILNISIRTIEFHFSNIKMKASCRSKLELLSKIKT